MRGDNQAIMLNTQANRGCVIQRVIKQPVLVFITALLLLSVHQFSRADEIQAGDNQPLPDIRWQDADGNTHHLNESNGKPRLLHFWASWCIPCREELPEMLAWQNENRDILVIPLSLDQRMAQTKHFVKKNNLPMSPLLINEDDSNALSIPVVPYTIFVSSDGLFVGHYYGIAPWLNKSFSSQVRGQFEIGVNNQID